MSFIAEVINWYEHNKRDLPWRNTNDPYIIWLSEVILQQTRVDQGLPYFYRFAERFPTVTDFAEADEEEILKLWQGLGYYSRGRNMHKTARMVMEEYEGYFPNRYSDLIKLKGIGEYTAAAISSFSANEPQAVVDGNVYRLLSRYFGIDEPINSSKAKRLFTKLANELIDVNRPGLSNQAIMEFGSLQCRPKAPLCETCPLLYNCVSYKTGRVNVLPVKEKKQKVRERFLNYFIAVNEGRVLLNKRGAGDIWQNLYEFPLIETKESLSSTALMSSDKFLKSFGSGCYFRGEYGPVKHMLSHQRLYVNYIFIENFKENFLDCTEWFYTDIETVASYPSPKIIFAFLEKFPNLRNI